MFGLFIARGASSSRLATQSVKSATVLFPFGKKRGYKWNEAEETFLPLVCRTVIREGGQKQINEAGSVLLGNGGLIDPPNMPPWATSNLPKWWIEPMNQLQFFFISDMTHRQPVESKVSISSTMELWEGRIFWSATNLRFWSENNEGITTHQIKHNKGMNPREKIVKAQIWGSKGFNGRGCGA